MVSKGGGGIRIGRRCVSDGTPRRGDAERIKQRTVVLPLVLVLLAFTVLPAAAYPGEGVDTHFSVKEIILRDFLSTRIPTKAAWSLYAVDMNSGKPLADIGPSRDTSLIPGSLVKLFVMAAILELDRKEKIKLDTIVATDGELRNGRMKGNLYLKGYGNSFLSEDDLARAASELSLRGVHSVEGDLIVDDSYFRVDSRSTPFQGPAYAYPSALGLDLNTISVSAAGSPLLITVIPRNSEVSVRTRSEGKSRIRKLTDTIYEIQGAQSMAPGIRKRFSLDDPSRYAGGTFRTLLEEKGIRVNGSVKKGKLPPRTRILITIPARPIAEIVNDTNRNSLNLIAENLLLVLGAKRFGPPGTTAKGVKAVKQFLRQSGFSDNDVTLVDGSGLSSRNRVSARSVALFLKSVENRPWFDRFYNSLPRAGLDGTLRNLGYTDELVRVKTGNLPDAYCLAGYVETRNTTKIAFAYLVNMPGAAQVWTLRESGSYLLQYLASELSSR